MKSGLKKQKPNFKQEQNSKKPFKRRKRIRNLIVILSITALLCTAGAIWNAAAANIENNAYPPPGQMTEVFGSQMHVFSSGQQKAGQPAIIFISGLATPSPVADFFPLWSRLDSEYFTVVLERPGYGWSESTKRERSLQNITEEDRLALRQAGINPPYILAAHSIGGLEANLFAADYPDEVSGVVLLDCTSPKAMMSQGSSVPFSSRMIPAARAIGLLLLINAFNPDFVTNQSAGMRNNFIMMDHYHKMLDRTFVLQNYRNSMMNQEQAHRMENARMAAENPFPSETPVSLVVAVRPGDEAYPEYQEFMQTQEEWVKQSETGTLQTMNGEHYIHHYAPEEICELIVSMIPK